MVVCTQHSIQVKGVLVACWHIYYSNYHAVQQWYEEYNMQADLHYSLEKHWQAV